MDGALCNLNENGMCICYLKKCEEIKDCALKRNLETVNKLIKWKIY